MTLFDPLLDRFGYLVLLDTLDPTVSAKTKSWHIPIPGKILQQCAHDTASSQPYLAVKYSPHNRCRQLGIYG